MGMENCILLKNSAVCFGSDVKIINRLLDLCEKCINGGMNNE